MPAHARVTAVSGGQAYGARGPGCGLCPAFSPASLLVSRLDSRRHTDLGAHEHLLHVQFRASEVKVDPLCAALSNTMDCSLPGPSVHGILQTSTLEWVAIPFSRGPSTPGTERRSPTLQADSFHRGHQGSPSRSREAWKLDSLRILSFSRFTLRSRTVVLKMINQSKILVEPDQNIRPFQGFYTSGKIQVIDCE